MAIHNELGEQGEQKAISYLIEKGYSILEKNYRYLKAEVDIIAQIEDTIIAVEVKTRSTEYYGNPEEFVTKKKIKLLVGAMDFYMSQKAPNLEIRFDIIAIIHKKSVFNINHIEDAFFYFDD